MILAGGGFWPPFAVAIAGGVLLSSVVSFYFVPATFALIHRRKKRMSTQDDGANDRTAQPALVAIAAQ